MDGSAVPSTKKAKTTSTSVPRLDTSDKKLETDGPGSDFSEDGGDNVLNDGQEFQQLDGQLEADVLQQKVNANLNESAANPPSKRAKVQET